MTLGIFAKTFARPTIEEVFDAVAHHRLRCVQFNFASAGLPSLPDAIGLECLERIRRAAEEHRIAIAAISGTFNMIHPDVKQRRGGLRGLGIVASACARLGASLVTLCSGTRDPDNLWRRHHDNDAPDAWRDLRVTLTKALTTAAKHGITLGLEPETGNVIDSARKARRLLDEMKAPRLKVVLDAANLFHRADLPRLNEILDEAFDLLGGDVVLAHAKELTFDDHPGGLALGTGALDWDHYLALLRQAPLAPPMILHGFAERDVTASVKFVRSKLAHRRAKG